MNYVNEDGSRFILTRDSRGWYVWMYGGNQEARRFKEIRGSKDLAKATDRLNAYAVKHNWVAYPSVICADCAQRVGKVWPEGHVATFYPAICDICGILSTVTESRDWGHFNTVEELKALYRVAHEGG